jgi:hypothetical protein
MHLSRSIPEYLIHPGWGGCVAIIFVKRFGRLPVLFWSQVSFRTLRAFNRSREITRFWLSDSWSEQPSHRLSKHLPVAFNFFSEKPTLTHRSIPLFDCILRVSRLTPNSLSVSLTAASERLRKSLYVRSIYVRIFQLTFLFEGLYVVTDLYPFHLQARKV